MAGPSARLSSALLVADVNDFLSPSQACVLPMEGGAVPEKRYEPAGSVLTPIVPKFLSDNTASTKATVTLSDCLSCTGCVTSAETVLLSSESVEKLRREILYALPENRKKIYAVAALSQQTVASIAVKVGLGLQDCALKLTAFLKAKLGFDTVIDIAFARHIVLLEAAEEFISRYRTGAGVVVASACPGWVTYAEKTQDDVILNSISRVRSPQAVAGALASKMVGPSDGRTIWLASFMPCHDKKIEASRPEFVEDSPEGPGKRETDCVLTTGELYDLLEEYNYDLRTSPKDALDPRFSLFPGQTKFGLATGSGSGGYADYILRSAAKEILGVTLPNGPLEMEKASRSGDMKSVVVKSADGSKHLRFATAYGFRSLQGILRKMRRGECSFDYIELMACPGGCNNGGGQLPVDYSETPNKAEGRAAKTAETELFRKVEECYYESPELNGSEGFETVQATYEKYIGGPPGSAQSKKKLSTNIVSRKLQSGGSLAW